MASLLDLFAIGFQSDNLKDFETELKKTEKELDKTEKDVKFLENSLKDLEKQGQQDSDTYKSIGKDLVNTRKKANELKKQLDTLNGSNSSKLLQLRQSTLKLVKTLGILATVGITLKKSLQFYEQAEQLDFLAEKAGITAEKLQALANAAKRFGGTTEGTASTVESLRSEETKKSFTEKGVKISYEADLKTVDVDKTLENVARKMETLKTDTEKIDLANSLGIDEGTTRLLIQGVERYREELQRADKYKLYTKEDIQRMRDYRQIQTDIRMGLDNIFGSIYRMLLPAITTVAKVVRGVTDFLAEHQGLVKISATLIGLAAALGLVVGAVYLLKNALSLLEKNHIVLIIIGIAAAITFLIALINDFIVFVQGGDSVIGRILEGLGVNTEKLRENIQNFFTNLTEWIKGAIDWFQSLGGKVAEFGKKLKALWDSIPEPLKKLIGGMANPITAAYTTITTGKEILTAANNNKLNSVPQGATANYNQTQAINNNNNTNARNINNSKTNQKNVRIDNVTIQTQATDAKGIKNELDVLTEFDDGVVA